MLTNVKNSSYLLGYELEGGKWELLRTGEPLNQDKLSRKFHNAWRMWGVAGILGFALIGAITFPVILYLVYIVGQSIGQIEPDAEFVLRIAILDGVIVMGLLGYFLGTEMATYRHINKQKNLTLDTPIASTQKQLLKSMVIAQNLGEVADRSNMTKAELRLLHFIKEFSTSKGQNFEATEILKTVEEAFYRSDQLSCSRGSGNPFPKESAKYKLTERRLDALMDSIDEWRIYAEKTLP